MSDFPERQRIRPTIEGRARLLAALEAVSPPHVVDSGALGEYAELVAVRGRAEADLRLPDVAAHLADGCPTCADDLRELVALAGAPDSAPGIPLTPGSPGGGPVDPHSSGPAQASDGTTALRSSPARAAEGAGAPEVSQPSALDSGIHVADLPDPRAAEAAELARLQRLRRIRD